jgi:eukaryotic-like serine/threonine-protein kinase
MDGWSATTGRSRGVLVSCLEPDVLLDYLGGRLDGASTSQARAHIAACSACHAVASDLVLAAAGAVSSHLPSARGASYELVAGAVVAGRYRLDEKLGEGAMGVVWRATRPDDGERVAIKFLKGFDQAARRRFEREVLLASSLVHPGLARVVEVLPDVEAGVPALVMEHLSGRSLAERLEGGAEDAPDACATALAVAETMAHVHDAGVVHRDIKPANVFLLAPHLEGRAAVKILDLGLGAVTSEAAMLATLSRITRTGQLVGTPAYMAPEQLAGGEVGAAADVWALGVTIFESLTATLPFTARTPAGLLRATIRDHATSMARLAARVPAPVAALVAAMLDGTAATRPRMAEVASSLRTWLSCDVARSTERAQERSRIMIQASPPSGKRPLE